MQRNSFPKVSTHIFRTLAFFSRTTQPMMRIHVSTGREVHVLAAIARNPKKLVLPEFGNRGGNLRDLQGSRIHNNADAKRIWEWGSAWRQGQDRRNDRRGWRRWGKTRFNPKSMPPSVRQNRPRATKPTTGECCGWSRPATLAPNGC